jgi:dynactin-6
MSSSKRASTAPPAPKPPVHFAPALVIADNAALTGTNLISIGLHTVIHPRTKLNSTYGPITIGSNCIISERSQIGFQSPPSSSLTEGVFIENGVVVEAGAIVEARKIGEGSVVEVNARIGKGAILGKVFWPLFGPDVLYTADDLPSIVRLEHCAKWQKVKSLKTSP